MMVYLLHSSTICFIVCCVMMVHGNITEEVLPNNNYHNKTSQCIHHDSFVIHWETGNVCPANITRVDKENVLRVISVFIEYTTVKCLKNLRTFSATMRRLFVSTASQYSCSDTKEYRILSTPCHTMYYLSWTASSKEWKIHVYRSFMINITIEEAYVPYNMDCLGNHITVYEGHSFNKSMLIDYFCGTISYASVYTKYNKGRIAFNVNTMRLSFKAFIFARYTSHIKGIAFKFIKPCLPSNITAPRKHIALLYKNTLHYSTHVK